MDYGCRMKKVKMRMLFIGLAFLFLSQYPNAMGGEVATAVDSVDPVPVLEAKNSKPKEVDCLEKCLQEHGATNHKSVQPWKNSCQKYHKKNPQKFEQCELDAKERIRLLDIGSIKTCQDNCLY